MKNKILAIVVTYNRLDDLKSCIECLRNQSYKDFDVIIINNGSTDGTKEWLDTQADLFVINQSNLGGAGGFYAGQKYAMDNGYEWVWMMDDDGLADKDELFELMKYKDQFACMNAIVLNKDDHSKFSFVGPYDKDVCMEVQDALEKEYLEGYICPFNGTIFKRELMEKIGLIKKEMFIWGDEQEYIARCKKNGFIPYTITAAKHYHPKEKGHYVYPYPWNKSIKLMTKPSRLSKYYYRNEGYLVREYSHGGKGDRRPWWVSALSHKWTCSFYFLTRLKFGELFKYHYYWRKGYLNQYD